MLQHLKYSEVQAESQRQNGLLYLCSHNADTKSSHLHSQMHSNKDKNTSQISQLIRNKHNRYAEAQDFLNQCFSTFFSLFTMACILITIKTAL
jgi:hypothetical protein